MCKFIVFCCVIFQTIVAVENIILLRENPSLSKLLTAGNVSVMEKYNSTNLGTISSVFNSVVISIMTLYLLGYSSSKLYKLFIAIVFMINVFYIFEAGSFINLLCLCVGFVLYLFVRVFKQKKTKILAGLIILTISIFIIFFIKDILYFLMSIVERDSYYYERLSETYKGLSNGWNGNFVFYRFSLYGNSLLTFIRNPIFGHGLLYTEDYSIIGMHSEICDFLGRFGIMGLCLVLSMLISLINEIKKEELNSKSFSPILVSCIINLLLNPMAGISTGIIMLIVVPAFMTLKKK